MVMVVKSRSELVDMQGVPSRDDGVQLVGGRVGGGGGVSYRWNRLRPAFMEPLVGRPPATVLLCNLIRGRDRLPFLSRMMLDISGT